MSCKTRLGVALGVAVGVAVVAAGPALANCDSEAGPVAAAGRQALERGDPASALVWVRPEDQPAVAAAFRETLVVRRKGQDAQRLADRYFLETLVRLHRTGEGKPYTGLRPAAEGIAPGMSLADQALAAGSADSVVAQLSETVSQGVRARFADVQRRQAYDLQDLAAGRDYVKSYVGFVYYLETLHRAAAAGRGAGAASPR